MKYNYEDNYEEMREYSEAKAHYYLYNKKKRAPLFEFSGTMDDESISIMRFFSLEEITHKAQLFVDAYNETHASDMSVNTIDQLTMRTPLYEFEDYNNRELKKFFKFFKSFDMKLYSFNLQPHYDYQMSCYFWDITKRKITKKHHFRADLTDKEYITLLTELLVHKTEYTFNDLVFEHPSIARKIAASRPVIDEDGFEFFGCPYLIILDEAIKDVEAIDGPAVASEEIY